MGNKNDNGQQARQDQIVTAARRCFRNSGFHAASMNQIATESRLSVGQIYRYYKNKDAIIEEIIRRIIDHRIAEISSKMQTTLIPDMLANRRSLSEDDDALMLEMSAEATRNPRVAALLAAADERMFSSACQQLSAEHPHLSEERVRQCVEVIAVMMEGTTYRRLTPQKAGGDSLKQVYQQMIDLLIRDNN